MNVGSYQKQILKKYFSGINVTILIAMTTNNKAPMNVIPITDKYKNILKKTNE